MVTRMACQLLLRNPTFKVFLAVSRCCFRRTIAVFTWLRKAKVTFSSVTHGHCWAVCRVWCAYCAPLSAADGVLSGAVGLARSRYSGVPLSSE